MGAPARPKLACAIAALSWTLAVAARPALADDRALAESLFEQGRQAMAARDYAAACPKLAESHRLDPALGTLLNLAVCHEEAGKIASAWAEFTDAAAEAKRLGQRDRESLARGRADALRARLPKLVLAVADTPGAEVTVKIDGKPIGKAAWGSPLPLDPGRHRIEADAPGYMQYASSVQLKESRTEDVRIPALTPQPTVTPSTTTQPPLIAPPSAPSDSAQSGNPPTQRPASPRDSAASGGSGWRTAGVVTAGVGLAGCIAGGIFGGLAMAKKSERDAVCQNGTCSSQAGIDADKDARTFATASTATFIAGGTLLVGGVLLWALVPPRAQAATAASESSSHARWVRPALELATMGQTTWEF